jgi:UDP-3-O-[3-hydroxymyristoyl] glucosamine N-acyltransferase
MHEETVGSLAERVGGRVVGDAGRRITGVGDLRSAGPEQLGFVRDLKYRDLARASGAGALLVPEPLETQAAQIVVANVPASFARIATVFFPLPRATSQRVHPTAVVDPGAVLESPVDVGARVVVERGARVGAGSVLKAGVTVGEGCRLGRDCVVFPGVVLYPGVTVGDRVILHANCVLGSDGFGYAPDGPRYVKLPQLGSVEIGDDVEIGAGTTIDRGALGVTRVGRGTKIDNLVHVGHNCTIGEDVAIAGFCAFSGSTVIGDRVAIAGHVVSSGHLKVADDVKIGGNSVIYFDLDQAGEYVGYPLQEKRQWFRTLRVLDKLLELQQDVRELKKR